MSAFDPHREATLLEIQCDAERLALIMADEAGDFTAGDVHFETLKRLTAELNLIPQQRQP